MPFPCLKSRDCHLIPPLNLFSCFFASPFALSVSSFSANDPDLLQKTLKHFSSELDFFVRLMLSSYEMMVGGMCSLLPCGTGICHYALI